MSHGLGCRLDHAVPGLIGSIGAVVDLVERVATSRSRGRAARLRRCRSRLRNLFPDRKRFHAATEREEGLHRLIALIVCVRLDRGPLDLHAVRICTKSAARRDVLVLRAERLDLCVRLKDVEAPPVRSGNSVFNPSSSRQLFGAALDEDVTLAPVFNADGRGPVEQCLRILLRRGRQVTPARRRRWARGGA